MTANTHPPHRLLTTLAPAVVGVLTASTGGLVLLGWLLDVGFLKAIAPDLPKMPPNAALGLTLAGIALWLLRAEPVPRRSQWFANLAAAITLLIGLLTLAEYSLGSQLGVDRLMFPDSVAADHSPIPGRPGFTTALALVMIGSALWLLDARPRRGPQPAQLLAVLSTLVALLALLGYAAGVPSFYGVIPSLTPSGMALHSAIVIALLGAGIVCSRPAQGLMVILQSHGADGIVGRRLLLVPVVLPLVTGLLRLEGQRRGLYHPDFGGWFFSMSNIAVFTLIIWWVASVLHRADAARVHATDRLRESDNQIKDLYDNAPCGYHSVGPDGIVLAMNETELRWLGYAATDVVGRLRFADLVTPASRALYGATFARVKEQGAAADVEIELVRKNGTTFPVLLNSSAIRDHAGRYLRSRTTLTDLTERKRAEAATRLFADAVENIPIGLIIYQIDRTGESPSLRIRSANPGASRLLGFPLEHTTGRAVKDVFTAIPEEQVRRYTEVALSGQADDLGEFRYGDEQVVERCWRVQAFPLPDRSVGVAFQDVTDRKRAEEEVHRLNENLERRVAERTAELEVVNRDLAHKNAENEMFVYSVSHDLRSPLVNLQGFSKELEKGCQHLTALLDEESVTLDVRGRGQALLGGKMAKSIGFIKAAVLRLSGIIDALLRLSRAGRVEYRREVIDVARVVGQVVGASQVTIAERGATVRIDNLPPAWGDRTAVEQVFGNLVGNALTYLDPARAGVIEIGALIGDRAGFRTYFVRDNGLGIAENHCPKIFQAFQRVHPGVGSGEGLGLTIVARVIERHGGQVWVESHPGEGSTFYFTLPILPTTGVV